MYCVLFWGQITHFSCVQGFLFTEKYVIVDLCVSVCVCERMLGQQRRWRTAGSKQSGTNSLVRRVELMSLCSGLKHSSDCPTTAALRRPKTWNEKIDVTSCLVLVKLNKHEFTSNKQTYSPLTLFSVTRRFKFKVVFRGASQSESK